MRKYLREILLWLFVIKLGTVFGAGLYEARVLIARWQNTPPQTWPNIGLRFWVYVTTRCPSRCSRSPIWSLLGRSRRRSRDQGGVSGALVHPPSPSWRGVRRFRSSFPRLIRLMESEEMAQEEVDATLSKWLRVDYGRNVLTLVGWLAALKALSLPAESSS